MGNWCMDPIEFSTDQNYQIPPGLMSAASPLESTPELVFFSSFLPRNLNIGKYLAEANAFQASSECEGSGLGRKVELEIRVEPDLTPETYTSAPARALFLTNPENLFVDRFFLEMSGDTKSLSLDATPFQNQEELIVARMQSFLESNTNCNYVSGFIARLDRKSNAPDGGIDLTEVQRAEILLNSGFDFVGISERTPESIFLVGEKLGWRSVPAFDAEKMIEPNMWSPDADELPIKLRRMIRNATAQDRVLYEGQLERLEASAVELNFDDNFRRFKRQPAFAPKAVVRHAATAYRAQAEKATAVGRASLLLAEDLRKNFEASIIGFETRLSQAQDAYESLLRQHLNVIGVIANDGDSK